jgi:hypothetical protein
VFMLMAAAHTLAATTTTSSADACRASAPIIVSKTARN